LRTNSSPEEATKRQLQYIAGSIPHRKCIAPSATAGENLLLLQYPVSNGSYNVNLDFAESYVTGPGQRIFNVSINGTEVLNNFDIYARRWHEHSVVKPSMSR